AFELFDQQSNETCDAREVGSILRSLNIYPSQEQLAALIKEMGEDEPSEYVTFSKFHKVALRLLSTGLMERANEETIFRAFKRLDTENKGYLLPDALKAYLTSQGEVFSNDEIDEMLTACTDPVEKKIFYDDYATILSQ
ncbi:hypothetical protein EDD86DRAFT_188673, partial [Gorgonomyces haynaldii]